MDDQQSRDDIDFKLRLEPWLPIIQFFIALALVYAALRFFA